MVNHDQTTIWLEYFLNILVATTLSMQIYANLSNGDV